MKITRLYVENVQAFDKFEYFPDQNINLIYGENGAGKSSFVEIFDLLIMIFKRQVLITIHDEPNLESIFDLYSNYSTVGNNDNMVIEFDFTIDKNGSYKIEINQNNEVAYEQLDYAINSRKSNIYKRNLNNEVLTKYTSLKNIIMKYELESQNSIISFVDLLKSRNLISNDSEEFVLIEKITNMFICNHKYHNNNFHIERTGIIQNTFIINENDLSDFKKYIEDDVLQQFKKFVYQIDDNILDIKYETTAFENNLQYKKNLVFTKELNGKLIDVPYAKESTGTKHYLEYFNYIHMAKSTDYIYIWDEVGVNLHQNLAMKIFDYMVKIMKENNRQMIMTSHSVSLLDSDVLTNKEKQFIINNSGSKAIKNLSGIDVKDKVSKKYLEGYYGAIPNLSPIWEFSE